MAQMRKTNIKRLLLSTDLPLNLDIQTYEWQYYKKQS